MNQRVHATLDPSFRQDPVLKENLLAALLHRIHVTNLNEERFRRFSVVSCGIDPSRIEELRSLVGIKSVEMDQQKRAAS